MDNDTNPQHDGEPGQDEQQECKLFAPWPHTRQDEALDNAIKRRPRQRRRTITLKFHDPTWRKVQNILWAHMHVTNLISRILEALREDPTRVRHDGAFECIQEMFRRRVAAKQLGKKLGTRSSTLSVVIEERFRDQNETGESDDLETETSTPPPHERPPLAILHPQDYPVIWTLRRGAFEACARMILLFYLNSQKKKKSASQENESDNNDVTHEFDVVEAGDETPTEVESIEGKGLDEFELDEENGEDDSMIDLGSADEIPSIETMHNVWAEHWHVYKKAAETKIPRGRDRGKAFGEALAQQRMRHGRHRGKLIRRPGKRRVRKLKRHMFPIKTIITALENVYVLLHEDEYRHDPVHIQEVKESKHLWRRDERMQRTPRASSLAQNRRDNNREFTSLESLSQEELRSYEAELLETLDQSRELEAIAQAVEIYLEAAPASYPMVEAIPSDLSSERALHRTDLDWYKHPVTKAASTVSVGDDVQITGVSVAERLARAEYEATTSLLRSESGIAERARQPLQYTQTMRPPKQTPSFALLYHPYYPTNEELDRRYRYLSEAMRQARIQQIRDQGYLYEYILVAVIHHGQYAFCGQHPADYFVPDLDEGEYFYVISPETPFEAPPNVSLMVFPLECGEEYHENEILRVLIERERTAQQRRFDAQFSKPDEPQLPLEECLPKRAAIGTARIITRQDGTDWYHCYAQFPVRVNIPQCEKPPEMVLGVSKHDGGYSWALRDMHGTLRDAGDVAIPWPVQPRPDATRYSDNYPYEVANAIVALAKQHNALIGLQETWRSKKTSVSRTATRRTFVHPDRKVADTIVDKALHAGLLRPRFVYGVSPWRCGACGNTSQNIRGREPTNSCYVCGSTGLAAHIEIPIGVETVAIVANIPEIPNLQLSQTAVAAIFWGNITHWDDPKIRNDNPQARLPHLPITVVFQSERARLTRRLSEWMREVKNQNGAEATGAGGAWAALHRVDSDEAMATLIHRTAGAVGYVDVDCALAEQLATVAVQNNDGKYLAPQGNCT
jgi:PBP superfamily domain